MANPANSASSRMPIASRDHQFAIPIRIVYVNSLNNFHFILEEDYAKLNELMSAMYQFYSSPSSASVVCTSKLKLGSLYSLYAYNEWYRARLLSIDQQQPMPDQQVVGSMQFELIDFGELIAVPCMELHRVARLLVRFAEMKPAALLGRLASVYPKPEETFNAAQALHNLVNKRVMYAFCRRAVNPASPTEQVANENGVSLAAKQSQTIIYHLDLFFVPTGWFQTECHYNGVDGKLLKAGLVHNRQDHLEVMHIGAVPCEYCGNGKEN
ncbi:hypothetical protein BOX15_Mlig024212g3 [Macrostomum lignano]|uniref:Tudor domain-containing protein n=2 Tax=Macrostomum lignano TaxID=282301 RepID=A0A1I8HLK5_9PLAT|nr:hypothetical protein BOX15_Mlig024212g3 [Macrostomum lignano]